ncbi:MAG: TolC family protein [Thermoanaerobaculales bacterium]
MLFALVAGLTGGGASAQQAAVSDTQALGLAEALRVIAGHSEAAIAAGLDLDAAREGTKRLEALYRPSVSLTGGYMARDNPIVGLLGAFQASETERDFFSGELDATYLLWDGGRRSSAVEASRRGEDATSQRGSAEVQAAVLDGLGTYLRALAFSAQRDVVQQRITSLQDHLRIAQDLYDHGVVARNDLLETEVRLRLVQDQASQVDNGEAVAKQTLDRLMGRAPSEPVALPAGLAPPPPLPSTIAELKQRAVAANPQLQTLRARQAAEEAGVAARKAEDYPSALAQASHTYQQNRYLLYPNANFLFLGVSWQAFDGGARKAAVREAEFAAAKTREQIGDLQRTLEIQLDQAYRDFEQARREAATAETNIGAAEENLRIEEDQYKAGLARTADVLDAESVLAESRFALVNRNYDAFLKQGTILSTAGEDLPAFFAAVKEQ